jgi:DNA-damage-inducible protein D
LNKENTLAVFENKKIRKIWHNEEWWFSVTDIMGALTESENPRDYWYKVKTREADSSGIELSTFCRQLKLESNDGKKYETDCTNTKGAFRIIQSIPSPKVEPFKLWLAKVGYDRVKEIQDPELAQKRMKELYEAKGYPKNWIEKRVRGIAIRDELTDEWRNRDVGAEKEYAILTAQICKETFGMTPSEYKKFKELRNENLRDHMNDLELIFSMLGERVTTEITKTKDSKGFVECKQSAKEGGQVAGNARKDAEKKIGKSIKTKENFKQLTKKRDYNNLSS